LLSLRRTRRREQIAGQRASDQKQNGSVFHVLY